MTPQELSKTIYLGDRAVKSICIDSWACQVRIRIDEISRIRSTDGEWHFYEDENIVDGEIVFEGVSRFTMTPPGFVPNDAVVSFVVEETHGGAYAAVLSAVSLDESGRSEVVAVTVVASGMHLADPSKPEQRIQS